MNTRAREFLYVEVFTSEGFDEVMDGAIGSRPNDSPLPSGGAIEEKVRIRLPDGTVLLGLSYRGDLASWRGVIASYCERSGRKWAIPTNEGFALSDGTEITLANCVVTFEP